MNCDRKALIRSRGCLEAIVRRLFAFMITIVCLWPGSTWAEEKKKNAEPGIVEQVETAVKNAADKVGKSFNSAVKQVEESETPKKVGNELQRSAESLGKKVEEAGKKLKQSFKSE